MEQTCNQLQEAVYSINVFLGDELISNGSGFAVSPTGQLITAAHVVTGRFPIRKEDLDDPEIKIWAKARGRPEHLYRPKFCGIDMSTDFLVGPIQLDIAVLNPVDNVSIESHLPISSRAPRLGEGVLMAGFSDEVELPFSLDQLFKPDMPGIDVFRAAMDRGYESDMMSLMIKMGMVGNIRHFSFSDPNCGIEIKGDIFYIDNGIHGGASGGPVVSQSGHAIGLITERARTSVSYKESPGLAVPSGSTVCLSLRPLLASMEEK